MTARLCGDSSSIDRDRDNVRGTPAERFHGHEELKESIRMIADIDVMRWILLAKGHVDREQHLITSDSFSDLSLC